MENITIINILFLSTGFVSGVFITLLVIYIYDYKKNYSMKNKSYMVNVHSMEPQNKHKDNSKQSYQNNNHLDFTGHNPCYSSEITVIKQGASLTSKEKVEQYSSKGLFAEDTLKIKTDKNTEIDSKVTREHFSNLSEDLHKRLPLQESRYLSFEAQVVEDFNEAMRSERFGPFRSSYSSLLKRVGPDENMSETATLVEKNDGDYYAIPEGEDDFLVLPRLGIVFADFHYGPGKMGDVFSCPDFDPTLTYEKIKVVAPAKFRRGGDGVLSLLDVGRLVLGDGKPL